MCSMQKSIAAPSQVTTDVPAPRDRLVSRWHWHSLLVVCDLLFRVYLAGAAALIVGWLSEALLGLAVEGKSLASIAAPSTSRGPS